jgi:hypothetical protein
MSTSPTDQVSFQRWDPVVYIQHPDIVSNLFQGITKPSDWLSCSLVSKNWKQVNENRNPRKVLVRAIDGNQLEVVVELLDQGLSPKFCIEGTKFVACAEDTPYLRAVSLHHHKIASVLKQKDGTFSEVMVKMKLDSLRFETTGTSFSIQDREFQRPKTAGVGHEFHHEYLLPDIIQSLKAYLMQRPDCAHWNRAKSQELFFALERSKELCPSCSPDELDNQLRNRAPNELIIFSDTSEFKHMHWISFAVKNHYYAYGNRGGDSGKYSGALICKSAAYLSWELMKTLRILDPQNYLDPAQYSKPGQMPGLYLECTPQNGPGCARASAEAGGVLGGIGVILCNEYEQKSAGRQLTEQELKQIHDTALGIFQEWIDFDQDSSLKSIMNNRYCNHNPKLFVRFLASRKYASRVAEDFYDFLGSKGPIPWFGVDSSFKIPCDYVPRTQENRRNYFSLESLLSRMILKARDQFNPDDEAFWGSQIDLILNVSLRGFDVQKGVIFSYAALSNSLSAPYTATGGLIQFKYDTKTRECEIYLTYPAVKRNKILNIAILFLHTRLSRAMKFKIGLTKFLPEQNSVLFATSLNSSKLGPFLKELRQVYGSDEDLSIKYSSEPKMAEWIKELKKICLNQEDKGYHIRLRDCLWALKLE